MFNYEKYAEIRDFIKKTKKNTQIISISKNHSIEAVNNAIQRGIRIFGENRVLEAKNKFENLKIKHSDIELHLTGPLQSNKTKIALDIFDVFHTIDREKIVNELTKYQDKISEKKFFVQVNTGKEDSKSGIYPENLKQFIHFCHNEKNLKVHGLMCIPPINDDPFKHFQHLNLMASENKIQNLSIGMSNDYQTALEFNPTYIRLGTILFGER